MFKLTVDRLFKMRDNCDQNIIGENEATWLTLVAIDCHAHELTG